MTSLLHSPFRRARRLLALLCLSAATGLPGARAAYVFDTIALSGAGTPYDRVGGTSTADDAEISMNASGQVAFIGQKDSTYGVYVGSGGALTTVTTETTTTDSGNVFRRELYQPVINDGGGLAWLRFLSGSGSSVRTGTVGSGTSVAQTGASFSSLSYVSISAGGTVTFSGGFGIGAGGLYQLAPGAQNYTVIASSTGPNGDLTGFYDLIRSPHSVSRSGTAAFHAYYDAQASFELGHEAIFAGAGGNASPVATDEGEFSSFSDSVGVNDSSAVAFVATLDTPKNGTGVTGGIYLASGGTTSLLESTTGDPDDFSGLCLANNGALSYVRLTATDVALYIRSAEGVTERVIGSGDKLAGKTIGYIYGSRSGLNESGQVAFLVYFKDFTYGVFRASVGVAGAGPHAGDDTVQIRGAEKIDVLANDSAAPGATLKITAVGAAAKGKASIVGGKAVKYTPGKTFDGTDSFTYTVTSNGQTATALVTVANPFLPLRGSFSQIVTANSAPAGTVAATVTPGGALTGKLLIAGKSYTLRGSVGFDGKFTQSIKRSPKGTPNLELSLAFARDGDLAKISGSVTGDDAPYAIAAGAAALGYLAPGIDAGAYTVLLPPDATAANPRGIGFATAKLSAKGKLTLTGKLADGTAFTASAVLNAANEARLYVPLYTKPKGLLAGTVTFGFGTASFAGPLTWTKPVPDKPKGLFPTGFTTTTAATGHTYIAEKNVPTLTYAAPAAAKADVHLRGADLPNVDAPISVSITDKATADAPNTNAVKITIKHPTGLISGSFIPTPGPGAKAVKFYGVEHQGENRAAGFFLGASQSGTVEFVPDITN